MRKLILFFFLLIIIKNSWALELWGEVTSELRIQNLEEISYPFEAKLGMEFSGSDFYSEFAIRGTNENSEDEVDVYRADVELYMDKFSLSLGRQKLVWGSAFLFNLTDVFNEIDIEDPRSEKPGTDSLRMRYSITDMSRLELVLFENNLSDNNLGARYTFLAGNFEFMLNYLNYRQQIEEEGEHRRNDLIFELKGDVEIGLWAQLEESWVEGNSSTTAVIGGDYTFDVSGKTLYALAEGLYNFDEKISGLYLAYRYDLSDFISFYQSGLFNPKGGSLFISTYLSYIFNDYVTSKAGVNFYDDMKQFGYETDSGEPLEEEVFLEVKLFF